MKNNIENLVEKFLNEAIVYSEAIPEGDKNKANKANKKMITIYKKINSLNGDIELKKLLNHDKDGVRLCAASNLAKSFPKESIKVLENIYKKDNVFSLLAEMGLDLLRRGQLGNN